MLPKLNAKPQGETGNTHQTHHDPSPPRDTRPPQSGPTAREPPCALSPHLQASLGETSPHCPSRLTTDSRGFVGLNSLALGFSVDFFTCLREKESQSAWLALSPPDTPQLPTDSLSNWALILVVSLDEAHRGAASLAWARWRGLLWALRASRRRQWWLVLLI